MARRRKKGNPLLMRIFVISVVVHIIALPIAAHYGAFKNIKRGFGDSHIVMLTTNLKESPDKPKEKAKEKAKKIEDHKKSSSDSKANGKAKGDNLPQPKVVTSGLANGTGGESGGPSAESGTGTAGKVPNAPKTNDEKKEPEVKKTIPLETVTTPKKADPPKPDPPKTDPPKPAEPKPKKIVEATVLEASGPQIPDELRAEPLDKTLVVEAQIDTGGHPINVSVISSTGIKELDKVGLEAARRYRFKPATIDGVASEQRVRFRIYFKVD